MSLFDFFFPEEAQAQHLRRLADSTSRANMEARINRVRQDHKDASDSQKMEALESDVAQLTILLEALLEKLEEKKEITRAELAQKVAEIDARDGVLDGKITELKPKPKPVFKPRLKFPNA